jgi:acyl-CoA thioester hydrolase
MNQDPGLLRRFAPHNDEAMSDKPTFERTLTAAPEHIDELGHVNNAVWVQWIQQVAVAHWERVASQAHKDAYFWVVVRHEIDYLRAAHEGDCITARTWVGDAPQGARFERFVEFSGADGKIRVRARTQWAIIDKSLGRPIRVPADVVAPFLTQE